MNVSEMGPSGSVLVYRTHALCGFVSDLSCMYLESS